MKKLLASFFAFALAAYPVMADGPGPLPGVQLGTTAGTAAAGNRACDNTGATDCSGAVSTTLGGVASRTNSARDGDFVRPEDYKLATDPDDTLSYQRAAATGRTLLLRDDKTYVLCASIALTRAIGEGTGAKIAACPGFTWTGGEPNNSFFHNPNWTAVGTYTADNNLLIKNVAFDGTNVTSNNGAFHAIKFRASTNVQVISVICTNIGDCTALQHDDVTLVADSMCRNDSNVCFDHWDSPRDATVRNNIAYCGSTGGGIMFTSSDSAADPNSTGNNLRSEGNRIFGPCPQAAMDVNILTATGYLTNFVSSNDYFNGCGIGNSGCTTLGFRLYGDVRHATFINPVLENQGVPNATPGSVVGAQAIAVSQSPLSSAQPSDVSIIHPVITNWATAAGNYAPLTLFGTVVHVTDNKITGGPTYYALAAYLSAPNSVLAGHMDAGFNGVFGSPAGQATFVTNDGRQPSTVVASLPACNASTEGAGFPVSDASSLGGAVASGGGSSYGMALCHNGTWTAH